MVITVLTNPDILNLTTTHVY